MTTLRSFLSTFAVGGLALLLASAPTGSAQAPAKAAPEVDVLARGPVHEAFAQPQEGQALEGPVAPKEPPPPIEELPPEQKPEGDNVQWIPGYWQWDEEAGKFAWVSGTWRVMPPGRQWVPGHYAKTESGFQWVPGFWGNANVSEQQVLPTPPASVESGPSMPAPEADSVYVPGVWVYRDTRFLWRPGYYTGFRPGWVWVPAHYVWTPAGCVFVDGYWDYPLDRRGLLFAPAFIDPGAIPSDWCYTPNFVVSADFLPSALFVRHRHGHYYFGDYFGPRYHRLGFTPWFDFRIGRGACDPLYGYYRSAYGGGPWERDLRALYAGRVRGTIDPPPRTLLQQNAFVQNNRATPRPFVTRGPGLVAGTPPLTSVTARGLSTVAATPTDRQEAQRAARQLRDFSRQRAVQEWRFTTAGATPTQPGDPPRTLNLNALSRVGTPNAQTVRTPPPPRAVPTDTGRPPRHPGGPDSGPRDVRIPSAPPARLGREFHSPVNPSSPSPTPLPPTRTLRTENSTPPPAAKSPSGPPPRIHRTESLPSQPPPRRRETAPAPPPPKNASPPPPSPKVVTPPPAPARSSPPPTRATPPPTHSAPPPARASSPPPPPVRSSPPPTRAAPPPAHSAPPPPRSSPPARASAPPPSGLSIFI